MTIDSPVEYLGDLDRRVRGRAGVCRGGLPRCVVQSAVKLLHLLVKLVDLVLVLWKRGREAMIQSGGYKTWRHGEPCASMVSKRSEIFQFLDGFGY